MNILIYGRGLTAALTTIALYGGVGKTCNIICVEPGEHPVDDCLFGGHAPPSAYEFFRTIGIAEPQLILGSDVTLSYGTRYANWPIGSGGWVQSFQQPVPPLFGVPFHHYLTMNTLNLEHFLISAQAALAGVFAHPPEQDDHPLSRAEYGYHFSSDSLVKLLEQHPANQSVNRFSGSISSVELNGDVIQSVCLDNGDQISADLFIDCSGQERTLASRLGVTYHAEARLSACFSKQDSTRLGPACRVITARTSGWDAQLHVQGFLNTLQISAPEDEPISGAQSNSRFFFDVGRLDEAWVGNCVAMGHSSCILEPLSPAPMLLLERNITRLLQLIPNTPDMQVERKEFNRLFNNDFDHASMFHQALFKTKPLPSTPYWQEKSDTVLSTGLQRKLEQFQSRGLLVQFDYEPFNVEDWVIQHFGLGRVPARHDIQAHRAPTHDVDRALEDLRTQIAKTVASMPPHHVYMEKFKDYLVRKQNGPA